MKYVRPGEGFEPNFCITEKTFVNGADTNPIYRFLKEKLPAPCDEPNILTTKREHIIWEPVCRNDISWNFEKFLISSNGEPFQRYSNIFPTANIGNDIKSLLPQVHI